jgi:DNA-binding transcriptional LysR family regulator
MSNRPMHMIQEGCDAGILPGKITDESVIARPAGKITLCLAASPSLIKSRRQVKQLSYLKSWPWLSLSGDQFWSSKQVKLFARGRAEQTLHISPVLISEGLPSVCEAVRAGLGVAVLPDWMIREDLLSGRLERVLPQWRPKELPVHMIYAGARLLPTRVRAFVCAFSCLINCAVGGFVQMLKLGHSHSSGGKA